MQRSPLVPLALAATASVAGGNLTVTVQPGSGFTTSASGALYVNVSSSGTVTAGN